jgi:phage-related protein
MLINGFDPYIYGAKLLDYSVDGSGISDNYMLPPSTIRPVRLRNRVRLRKIMLAFDFEDADIHGATQNLSEITAILRQEANLLLPDGFYYHCILTSTGKADIKAPWILRNSFSLVGYRHGPLIQETLTETGSIFVEGNYDTEAVYEITTSAQSITVNGITVSNISGVILIDGLNKAIKQGNFNKFADSNITAFPVLQPGVNQISISSPATVVIKYYPVYI